MRVKPGLYRHYKGGMYRVLGTARESTNARAEPAAFVVVYISLTTGRLHVRDLEEFIERVVADDGAMDSRFRHIEEM